jgi:outer membrane receptor protein involved in Fe transport
MENLQTSILKNGNRAVYRSQMLVDDDAAARAASIANIYQNLGFEKLAIAESAKALGENPSNFSAHRQLADAYSNLPRHDIARVSEELQAQLRQPVALASVGPQLGTDNLAISKDSGPARPGANEFNALFNQDGTRVRFDGIAGNLGTWGNKFVGSALIDRLSLSLSQLHYETDGFTDNDAAVKDIYGLTAHAKVSPASSLQVEVKHTELNIGRTFFSFDEFPFPLTIGDRSDRLRISGFHDYGTSGNWIWSGIVEDRKRDIRSFPDDTLFTRSKAEPFAVEAEYSGPMGGFDVVSGVSYIQEVERFDLDLVDIHKESAAAFVYTQWHASSDDVSVEAGAAAEWYKQRSFSELTPDRDPLDRTRLSPKLGVVWTPAEGTTIRAAAFSAVRRPFIGSQTIEPTQVAGFNQFFTGFERFYGDVNGVISDRVGIAVDQAFSASTFGGLEVSAREIKFPSFGPDGDFTWQERSGHAYAYRTFSKALNGPLGEWQGSISADVEYEKIERPQPLTGAEGIIDLETISVPLGLRLFNDRGTIVRLATTFIQQNGTFSIDVPSPDVSKDEQAWITDLSIEQFLPRRHGSISLGVRNAFDEEVELVEIDPLNPRVATKRFVYGTFKLVF